MLNGVVEITGVFQQDGWRSSFTTVVLLMLFVVISTFPPPSGIPASGATTCWMWIVHGDDAAEVVGEWLKEKREEARVSVTFCKPQVHELNDFTSLPHKRPKRCNASLREGELTQPRTLRVAIEV